MTKGECKRLSLALYNVAKVEEELNNVDFIKSVNSTDSINDLHIAMNLLAQMIVDDTRNSIELHESVKEMVKN